MIASRKDHEREQKESWFLNVIVLPLLPEFKTFYDGLVDNVKEQRGRINNTPPGHDNENRLELMGKIEDEMVVLSWILQPCIRVGWVL